jgi:very-short-patch-repair endonuclease
MGQRVDPMKIARARELRREQTPAEQALWELLKGKQLDGFKFRRQQVIDGFIADFYCNGAELIIEIDGGVHENRMEADAVKEAVFRGRGLLTLRFTNEEVLESPESVCQRIASACRGRSLRSNLDQK